MYSPLIKWMNIYATLHDWQIICINTTFTFRSSYTKHCTYEQFQNCIEYHYTRWDDVKNQMGAVAKENEENIHIPSGSNLLKYLRNGLWIQKCVLICKILAIQLFFHSQLFEIIFFTWNYTFLIHVEWSAQSNQCSRISIRIS